MPNLIILLLIALSTLIPEQSYSYNHKLFIWTDIPYANYNSTVRTIQPGDTVTFSNGQYFKIRNVLGYGNNQIVLSIYENADLALRIPFYDNKIETMQHFIDGQKSLADYNVPHAKVIQRYNNEYILVERQGGRLITFDDFVKKYKTSLAKSIHSIIGENPLNTEEYKRMSQDFIEFAKKIALFSRIGDLHSGNIVYNTYSKKWIILDWNDLHKIAKSPRQATPLETIIYRYGHIDGLNFYPSEKQYAFLKPVIETSLKEIQQIRRIELHPQKCRMSLFN